MKQLVFKIVTCTVMPWRLDNNRKKILFTADFHYDMVQKIFNSILIALITWDHIRVQLHGFNSRNSDLLCCE